MFAAESGLAKIPYPPIADMGTAWLVLAAKLVFLRFFIDGLVQYGGEGRHGIQGREGRFFMFISPRLPRQGRMKPSAVSRMRFARFAESVVLSSIR